MGRHKSDPIERFFSKIIFDDCWIFSDLERDGYGRFQVDGKQWRAHRYMLYLLGKLDPNLPVVLHTCDNPSCVNPDHLICGTIADNNRDKMLKGRSTKNRKYGPRKK